MRKVYLWAIVLATFGSLAAAEPPSFYDSMAVPTEKEQEALQRSAKKHHIEFMEALHDMSEDDLQSWTKIFAVSLDFKSWDRSAQVYGYHIFGSWLYFVASCGCEKYAKLVDAQPAAVRQRIRDLLFADAALAPKEIRDAKERELREKYSSLFPRDYVFGKDDALFKKG